MNRFAICLFLALFFGTFLPGTSFAQSTITFRIDMSAQIKDSTFIPSRHTVAIAGDQVPFSQTHTITMHDETGDSIFVAKVHFPAFVRGRELKFHYLIKKSTTTVQEQNPRFTTLSDESRKLPVVGFNELLQ